MRSRALGMAQALHDHGWDAAIVTVPWDNPADVGRSWIERGIPIHNTATVQPRSWPLAVSEIVREAHWFQPDLIHVFKPKGFGDLAARWLARSYPVVVDMDDWEGDGGWNDSGLYSLPERRLFDWQERTLPSQSDAVTVASRVLRDHAIDGGAASRGIFYMSNALTAARFDELAPVSSPPPNNTILLYTRFVEFDPASIAIVMATVRDAVPDAKLLVAGGSADGRAEQILKDAAVRLGVDRSIEWAGWIEPGQLAEIAARCRVAIHPFDNTVLNRAKCSVKLLELMASALPVVTTAVGENKTFTEGGRTGVLVTPGDPEALAAAVIDLLENVDRCRTIGQAARERVRQHFLWDRRIDTLLAAYQYALARH